MVGKTYRTVGMLALGDDWYQRPVAKAIQEASFRRRLFVDVGAHHGSITRQTSPYFKKVLVVEPDPKHVKHLTEATRQLGNVEIVGRALGAVTGRMPLYGDPLNDGDQSLVARPHYTKVGDVEVCTMDGLLENEKLDDGVVIKLDVQGYEPMVIAGAESTLSADCFLISEFWPWGIREAGSDAQDFLAQMSAAGYEALTLKGRAFEAKWLSRFIDLGRSDRYLVTEIVFVRGSPK